MLYLVLLVSSFLPGVRTSYPCEHILADTESLVLDCRKKSLVAITNFSTSEDIAGKVIAINLSHNNITRINARAFRGFPNTQKMDLSYNLLSSLHEEAFAGLRHLVELNIGFNPLLVFGGQSYAPGIFKGLLSLEKIILSGSNASSILGWPIEALSEVGNLSNLMITRSSEHIFPIPVSLTDRTRLHSLAFVQSDIEHLRHWHIANIANSTIDTISFSGRISHIGHDAFDNFSNLKTLNLACNRWLDLSHVFDVLSTSVNHSIDSLALDMASTGRQLLWSKDAQSGCRSILPRLRRLTVRGCGIRGFHTVGYACLSNLEIFAIGFNSPYFTDRLYTSIQEQMGTLPPKLTVLDYQYGLVTSYWHAMKTTGCSEQSETFFQDAESVFPKIPRLISMSLPMTPPKGEEDPAILADWDGTSLYQEDAHGCWHSYGAPVMRVLLVQHIVFQRVEEVRCLKMHDLNLRFANMSSTGALKRLVGPVSGLDQVQVMDLSIGILQSVSRGSIRSLASMTHLNLSRNQLGVGGFKLDLSMAPNLLELDLSSNGITSLNWTLFSAALKMEYFKLGDNKLTSVELVLTSLRMLKLLDLRKNHINWLHNTFTSALDGHHERTGIRLDLDLRDNALSCQCDALDFVEWSQNTERVTLIGKESLQCKSADAQNVSLIGFSVLEYRKRCSHSNFSLILTVVLLPIGIALLSALSAVMCYRFRWYIKWEYHKLKRRFRHRSDQTLTLRRGGYDAYVAYASDDERTRRWVCGPLREELEEKRPFFLFLEDRNSPAGGAVADNIVEALDHSRCSLWILNDAFLKNEWCDYALHMSLVCHGQSRICIVLMSEVGQATTMPRYLESILHPRSDFFRVEQTSNAAGVELMWTTLNNFLLQRRVAPKQTMAK